MLSRIWETVCSLLKQEIHQDEKEIAVESEMPQQPLQNAVLLDRQPPSKPDCGEELSDVEPAIQRRQADTSSFKVYERTGPQPDTPDVNEETIFALKQLSSALRVCQEKSERLCELREVFDPECNIRRAYSLLPSEKEKETMFTEYEKDILQVRNFKYSRKRMEFPDIHYKEYVGVRKIWERDCDETYKTVAIGSVANKLTYRSLHSLKFQQWLNDDIVNGYIELMEREKVARQIKTLNSFFVKSVLEKPFNQVERVLERKKITQAHILLVVIHSEKQKHWYFVKLHEDRLTIYDSIRKREEYYEHLEEIKRLRKFSQSYQGVDPVLSVCRDFPQQSNGYDCGVFMLLGIKDVIRDTPWTFSGSQIRFKRIHLTLELIQEKAHGFQ